MKLRMAKDSVRLRLSPEEFDRFLNGQAVRESAGFSSGSELTWILESNPSSSTVEVAFLDHSLFVRVPKAWVLELAEGTRTQIEQNQPLGPSSGRTLSILIEKDLIKHKRSKSQEANHE